MSDKEHNELILLGAGASKEAGLPLATELTWSLYDQMEGQEELAVAYRYATHQIAARLAACGMNPRKALNVEDVFEAIEQLADRENLPISAFVDSWHRDLRSVEYSNAVSKEYFYNQLEDLIYAPLRESLKQYSASGVQELVTLFREQLNYLNKQTRDEKFGKALEAAISVARGELGVHNAFARVKYSIQTILRQLLWLTDQAKVEYLAPLVMYCKQTNVPIVTLNYDNLVELCAERQGIDCDTGLGNWRSTGVLDFDTSALRLLKLHGSLDWADCRQLDSIVPEILYYKKPNREVTNPEILYDPGIIFGKGNKIRAESPFFELLHEFCHLLGEADLITVIGYSFGDDHVNTLFYRWLNAGNKKIRVVNGPRFRIEGTLFGRDPFGNRTDGLNKYVDVLPFCASKGIQNLFGAVTGSVS